MDQHGIETMLLSLNAPAVQAIPDTAHAHDMARRANDYLAEQVGKRPDRFQGLAALAMQDPEIAARELERCVKELGFRGALVNGFSQVGDADTAVYYDLPQYRPFWATAVHALRLMGSGLFDAHPRLQIILGHMGENLPFALWRVDNANAWITERHSWPAKRRLSDYFRENFYVTTSGNF